MISGSFLHFSHFWSFWAKISHKSHLGHKPGLGAQKLILKLYFWLGGEILIKMSILPKQNDFWFHLVILVILVIFGRNRPTTLIWP